jgi:hypothetical protein
MPWSTLHQHTKIILQVQQWTNLNNITEFNRNKRTLHPNQNLKSRLDNQQRDNSRYPSINSPKATNPARRLPIHTDR